MKKLTNKIKGFTLTELAIVIAVIAILIAVLVPTFISLINSANESNDVITVRNMNTVLSTETDDIDKPTDALQIVYEEGGYSVANMTPKSTGKIVYDELTTSFVFVYSDGTTYPENVTTNFTAYTTWELVSTNDIEADENGEYHFEKSSYANNSIILKGSDWAGKTVYANYGVELWNDNDTSTTLNSLYVVNTDSSVQTAETGSVSLAKSAIKTAGSADSARNIIVNVRTNYLSYSAEVYNISDHSTVNTLLSTAGKGTYYQYGTTNAYDITNSSNANVVVCNEKQADKINNNEVAIITTSDVTTSDCISDSTGTVTVSIDDDVTTIVVALSDSETVQVTITEEGTVTITAGDTEITVDTETTLSEVANNTGLGTEDYPYLIASEADYDKVNNGGYCKVTADITATTTLTISGVTVVLDLNGHSLTSSNSITISVAKNATLTINGTGTITTSATTSKAINNLGTLTLNNVTISGKGYGIYTSTNLTAKVTATINGGSITSTGTDSIYVKAPKATVEVNDADIETTGSLKNAINNDSGTVTITGSKTILYSKAGAAIKSTKSYSSATTIININAGTITSDKYAIYVVKGTTINMTGGKVESNGTATVNYGIWLVSGTTDTTKSTLNISGGEVISNASYGIYVNGANVKYEEVNISGTASIVSNATNSSYCVGVLNNKGVVNISGGTITAENGVGVYNNASSGNELNISGGTISGNRGIENLYTMTMTGGTVIGEEIAVYIAEGTAGKLTSISGNAVVKVDSSVEDAWGYGIYLGSGMALSISGNAKIMATNAAGATSGIFCVGSGDSSKYTTMTISGGTISGDAYGIAGNGSNAYTDVTISGGSIIGGTAGYYHPEDGTLDISGGSITGKYAGLQICAGTVTILGGTFTATATSEEISESSANVANKSGDGVIHDGAALSIINRSGYGTYSTTGSSITKVTVTGGTFTTESGEDAIQVYSYQGTNEKLDWTDVDSYVTISVYE